MSIEQNGSGFLDLSSNIISGGDYTVLVYVKLNSASNFDTVFTYDNTASDFLKIQHWSTDFRGDLDQQFTNQVTGGSVVANTWQRVMLSAESTGNNPRIVVDGAGVTSGGQTGTFQAPSSPQLRLFGNTDGSRILPNGCKIGLLAIYNSQLDTTDEAFLDGGGDPSDLPSATAPVEVWLDTQGISTSGSNVTTWTGINGNVLTASGSLLEDGADLAPVTIGGATSIAQTDTTPEDGVQQTVTCTGMTGPITAATLGGYDILSLLSGTDPASPITYTLDISSLAEGTNASLPRLGVSLDLVFTTATDGAVTQSGIVIQPKTGWALVELEDTINKDANGLGATIEADTGITITNADAVYYETANNASITVNLVYTSDLTTAGQSTKIILQDGGTSPAASYSDGFYPYGEAGGSGVPKTKYRRFPWQPWNPL